MWPNLVFKRLINSRFSSIFKLLNLSCFCFQRQDVGGRFRDSVWRRGHLPGVQGSCRHPAPEWLCDPGSSDVQAGRKGTGGWGGGPAVTQPPELAGVRPGPAPSPHPRGGPLGAPSTLSKGVGRARQWPLSSGSWSSPVPTVPSLGSPPHTLGAGLAPQP